MTTRVFDGGPFHINLCLYRLGFDWDELGELQPGWTDATWEVPKWAKSDGIVGEWKLIRHRLVFRTLAGRIPLTAWREGPAPWPRRAPIKGWAA
jgi:hypothetical protein